MLEEKLRVAEAKISELTKENNLLKKVQDHQGKALVSLSNEEDYPLISKSDTNIMEVVPSKQLVLINDKKVQLKNKDM